MTIARPKGTHHQDSGAKKRGYRAVPLFRPIIIIIIIIIIILSSMVQGVIMHCLGSAVLLLLILCVVLQQGAAACSGGRCELGDRCSSEADCGSELYCYNCWIEFAGRRCVRTTAADPFKIVDTSLPFNRYAFLTTHNSFSIRGEPSRTGVPRITLYNQDDSVTDQLNNGVRALMLDVYDFRDDIWLCHSKGGKCFDFTAFEPAIGTMMEVEAFLSANPSEIVTLILEDYVGSDRGLSKLVDAAGLTKYWFPVSGMPRDGGDWPRVGDMIRRNHRLLVFTSDESKQRAEGIAYQWNFMVESQYGDGGMSSRACRRRAESLALDNRTRSLVLVNYFHTVPLRVTACVEHSLGLADVLGACHAAAGNRWANFLAVDYYKVEKRRRRRVRGHGHAQRDAHLRPRRRASVHETDSQGRVLRPAWQGRADAGSRCAKDMRSRSVLVGCACHVCCTHVACPAMRYA